MRECRDLELSASGATGFRCATAEAKIPPASGVARGQPFLAHSPLCIPGRTSPRAMEPRPKRSLILSIACINRRVLQRPVLKQRSNRIAGRRQVKQHHAGLAVGKALPPEAFEYSQGCRNDNAAVERLAPGTPPMPRSYIEGRRYRNCRSRWTPGDCRYHLIGTADFLRRPFRKGQRCPSRTCPRSAIARLKLREAAGGLFRGGLCLQFMTRRCRAARAPS